MSVDAAAWTSRVAVREYLQLAASETDKDDLIDNLINRSYKALEAHIGKAILSASYTEYYDGDGQDILILDNYPIISVDSLYMDSARDFAADTLIAVADYVIYAKQGTIRLLNDETIFAHGIQNIKITYTAGYAAIPNDLALACIMHVSHILQKAGAEGHLSMSLGGLSKSFDMTQIPLAVKTLLEPYRKRSV